MKRLLTQKPKALLRSLALVGLLMVLLFAEAAACNYNYKVNMFNDAVNRYRQLQMSGASNTALMHAARAICNIRRGIEWKFKNRPIPDIPDDLGIDCDAIANIPAPGGGGGRGGTTGGFGSPGSNVPYYVWLRNQTDSTCNYEWTIIMESGNPNEFMLSQTSGTISVPPFSTEPPVVDPIMISLSANVSPGSTACFRIEFTDLCTGEPFGGEFSNFEVTVLSDLLVEPIEPVVPIPDTGTVFASWRVTNTSNATVTYDYSFKDMPEPFSQMTLNDTTQRYGISNLVPTNKTNTGGTVTIAPNSSVIIEKEVQSTLVCDPEMLGCCALEIAGISCCVIMPSQRDAIPSDCASGWELTGEPPIGGTGLSLQIFSSTGEYFVEITASPSSSLEDIVDNLAMAVLQQFQTVDGFNFQPLVAGNKFFLMVPPGFDYFIESFSPTLQWTPVVCDLTVGLDELPSSSTPSFDFQLYPTVVESNLELMVSLKKAATPYGQIVNLLGQPVGQGLVFQQLQAGDHQHHIAVNNLIPGIYLFYLEVDHQRKAKKFIVR